MSRPPRKEFAGALHHVTSRGNGRAQIFFEDVDRKRFLIQLQDCLEQYDVILYAYVLMANHYHLLVRTRQANLGRFMHRLNTSYALYSRYKHKKPGHRLEGRGPLYMQILLPAGLPAHHRWISDSCDVTALQGWANPLLFNFNKKGEEA